MNPRVIQSVRVTARHHALFGRVVRVVGHKRYRGEAHVVVEVDDGSRRLVAVRSTELSDERSPAAGLHFTPGSLRSLRGVIDDLRCRVDRADGAAKGPAEEPAAVGAAPAGDEAAGRAALDRAAGAPAALVRPGGAGDRCGP